MAEHSAVNRRVVSSSLTCGANRINKLARHRMAGFRVLSKNLTKTLLSSLVGLDKGPDAVLLKTTLESHPCRNLFVPPYAFGKGWSRKYRVPLLLLPG